MELRAIRSFLSVSNLLSFHRAAQHLGVSQPALTMQIQSLEDALGVQLLERNRQTTSLTYVGSVFRHDAQKLLNRVQYATERTRRAAKGLVGLLRIGFISTLATTSFLPPLISRFRQMHGEMELSLKNLLTVEQIPLLESGQLDVGFFRLPLAQPKDIEVTTVLREPLAVLLPQHHPLAHKPGLTLEALRDSPFVVYSRHHAPGYHDFIMRLLDSAGFNPVIAQEAGEMYTLVSLVAAGFGVALAPSSTRRYHLEGVVWRSLPSLPRAEIAVGIRKDNSQPACRALVELAKTLEHPVEAPPDEPVAQ